MVDTIGMVAAVLTTLSFLPQAIMVCRTGNTDSISLLMYITFTIGVAGWLSYGLMLGSVPIIAANGLTLVFASTILAMKCHSVAFEAMQRRRHTA